MGQGKNGVKVHIAGLVRDPADRRSGREKNEPAQTIQTPCQTVGAPYSGGRSWLARELLPMHDGDGPERAPFQLN